jgi:hypothetical protein
MELSSLGSNPTSAILVVWPWSTFFITLSIHFPVLNGGTVVNCKVALNTKNIIVEGSGVGLELR